MRQGVTLFETMVAIAVIAIVAAIFFSIAAPARESGRRAGCKSNLQQIYRAMELYGSDHGTDGHKVGLTEFPLLPLKSPKTLVPYLKSKDCMYCPDFPVRGRKILFSSYMWRPIGKHLYPNAPGRYEHDLERIEREVREKGAAVPIVQCFVHDELVERPREGLTDGLVTQPFVVELHANGAVTSGRRPYPRTNAILPLLERTTR